MTLLGCHKFPSLIVLAVALVAGGFLASASAAQEHDPHAPPFIATSAELTEQMLSLAEVSSADTVYDLGSGDGRLVIAAAARGARGVGIEYDSALVELSWANAEAAGVSDRVTFVHQDIFASQFRDATVVLLYLGPVFNLRIRSALLEQLRPGSRVVSHAFHMGEWEADSLLVVGTGAGRANLYSWIIPARVDGFWSLEIEGAPPLDLELLQQFQKVTGTIRSDEQTFRISGGSLRGTSIEFEMVEGLSDTAAAVRFAGNAVDGRLEGVVSGPGPWNGRQWRALRFSDSSRASR